MRRNTTIDVFKMICAVLVIAIHSDLFIDVNDLLYLNFTNGIARIAVPFFFVVSGYFFYDRVVRERPVRPYLLKILIFFLCFTLVDGLTYFLLNPESVLADVWDFLHMVFLSGARLKYWYMTSLLLALVIVIPFWKKKLIWPCLVAGILLYIVMMTSDSYFVLFHNVLPGKFYETVFTYCNVFHGPQAGISSSLMFVSLGALIHKYKPVYRTGLLILVSVLFFAELNVVQHTYFYGGRMYLMLIFLAPMIFMYCLEHPGKEFDTSYFSDWCLLVYMTHHYVVYALMDIGITGSLNFLITAITIVPLNYFIARMIRDRKKKKQVTA
ncbi:MAG: acyltransferase [Clostridiales bacterium]|nr:acyltransferase [Clostridiales bacterium]